MTETELKELELYLDRRQAAHSLFLIDTVLTGGFL